MTAHAREAYEKRFEIEWIEQQIAELCARRERVLLEFQHQNRVVYNFEDDCFADKSRV